MATNNDPHGGTGLRGDDHAGSATKGDDHAGPTGIDPVALKRGHEMDDLDVKGILVVPAIILCGGLLAFIVVTLIVNYNLSPSQEPPTVNPLSAKRNAAPINERLGRISSDDPNAEVKQPRLEGLREGRQDPSVPGGDTEHQRSRLPAVEGNSPEYHPEDLRYDRWTDPSKPGERPPLMSYGWTDEHQTAARIPIERAMTLALETGKLPVRKDPIDLNAVPPSGQPKMSNGGRGPERREQGGKK